VPQPQSSAIDPHRLLPGRHGQLAVPVKLPLGRLKRHRNSDLSGVSVAAIAVSANKNEDRPARRGGEKSRRGRDSADEEWRSVRGDPRNYYSYSEDAEEEPAPTTAEELVARFWPQGCEQVAHCVNPDSGYDKSRRHRRALVLSDCPLRSVDIPMPRA